MKQRLEQKVAEFATAPSGGSSRRPRSATAAAGRRRRPPRRLTTAALVEAVDSSQFITNPDSVADARHVEADRAETPFKVMAPGYLPAGLRLLRTATLRRGAGYDIDTGERNQEGPQDGLPACSRDGTPYHSIWASWRPTGWTRQRPSPGDRFTYNGITYTVVGTYDQTERVWWKKDGVLYWVSNTILHYLNIRRAYQGGCFDDDHRDRDDSVKDKPYKVHAGKRRRAASGCGPSCGSSGRSGGHSGRRGRRLLPVAGRQGARPPTTGCSQDVRRRSGRTTRPACPARGRRPSAECSGSATNILVWAPTLALETVEGSRSDTIILLHVDPANNYMTMLSLPRDLRVEVEATARTSSTTPSPRVARPSPSRPSSR